MIAWPTVDEGAFHGPAGEFVLRPEPHTEADPIALLTQFLAFGAAAGRRVRYTVEASAHHLTGEPAGTARRNLASCRPRRMTRQRSRR